MIREKDRERQPSQHELIIPQKSRGKLRQECILRAEHSECCAGVSSVLGDLVTKPQAPQR